MEKDAELAGYDEVHFFTLGVLRNDLVLGQEDLVLEVLDDKIDSKRLGITKILILTDDILGDETEYLVLQVW